MLVGLLKRELPRYGSPCGDLQQRRDQQQQAAAQGQEDEEGEEEEEEEDEDEEQDGEEEEGAYGGGTPGIVVKTKSRKAPGLALSPAAMGSEAVRGSTPLHEVRWMPTRKQLMEAGRSDLIQLIDRVGGFSQVGCVCVCVSAFVWVSERVRETVRVCVCVLGGCCVHTHAPECSHVCVCVVPIRAGPGLCPRSCCGSGSYSPDHEVGIPSPCQSGSLSDQRADVVLHKGMWCRIHPSFIALLGPNGCCMSVYPFLLAAERLMALLVGLACVTGLAWSLDGLHPDP